MKDYVSEKNAGYRYVLVVIDNFSKFGWTVPLKSKKAQKIKYSFENILITSRRKQNLMKTDRGEEFYNTIFQKFQNNNNIKYYSINTSSGAVFEENFNRTIRDLLEIPAFERRDANWFDILPTITKQYNNI